MEESEKKKYLDRSDVIIEGNTARWDMRIEGSIYGTYTGTFRFKCFLTPTEKLSAGRKYRELLGPNPTIALEHEDNLAFALAQLEHRIISAPPFWSSTLQQNGQAGDIADENVVHEALDAAIAAQLKFAAQLQQKKKEVLENARKAAERLLKNQDEEMDESQSQEDGN